MATREENLGRRPIRSFVLRPGRMTPGQRQALEYHWPQRGLELVDGVIDSTRVFGREANTVLEIGFGMGESLAEMAGQNPGINYIGVEVHPPGVGKLLWLCAQGGVDNIRVYRDDAVDVLKQCIPENSLDGVQLYFPDPWPKKKHHKRRLVQEEFVRLVASRLKQGGYFHMATDWQNYAESMLAVMALQQNFINCGGLDQYIPRPAWRPNTKFERRGERLGHGVWDLLFEKSPV